ncbi:MAG: VOC family protein [Alphaproteobacteria bacterium]|nr:VOC family protein [Alphaproteobacteria bacterium]
MLQVDDVEASSRWYQAILGLVSGHGGAEYEMLFDGEPFVTPLVMQLHRWDAREHGFMGDPAIPRGNGASLWFEVDDRAALDAVWARVGAHHAKVVEPPHWSPLAHHHELAIQDPDGYLVVVCTPFE